MCLYQDYEADQERQDEQDNPSDDEPLTANEMFAPLGEDESGGITFTAEVVFPMPQVGNVRQVEIVGTNPPRLLNPERADLLPSDIPAIGSTALGFAVSPPDNYILYDIRGTVRTNTMLPLVMIVEPPADRTGFEPVSADDMVALQNGYGGPVPALGDQAHGWWMIDHVLRHGVGTVVRIWPDVTATWVDIPVLIVLGPGEEEDDDDYEGPPIEFLG
ncbi:hypothetical protein BJX99DRAFT_265416 [Aspergillus californicus]